MQNTVLQPTSPVEVKLMSAFIRNPSQIESDTDPNLNQVEYSANSDLSLNPTKRIVCTRCHKSWRQRPRSCCRWNPRQPTLIKVKIREASFAHLNLENSSLKKCSVWWQHLTCPHFHSIPVSIWVALRLSCHCSNTYHSTRAQAHTHSHDICRRHCPWRKNHIQHPHSHRKRVKRQILRRGLIWSSSCDFVLWGRVVGRVSQLAACPH